MKATLSVGKIMQGMTMEVTITGARVLKARIWLGSWLIRLAAIVIGCNIEIRMPK